MEPEVIIMDEPTSNLDPRATSEILHLLLQLTGRKSITLLLATHDVDMVPLLQHKYMSSQRQTSFRRNTKRNLF